MFGLSRLLQLAGNVTFSLNRKQKGRRLSGTRSVRREAMVVEELEGRVVPTLLGQQVFPSDNPWNQNIANAPVASNSAAVIAHIGASIRLHPDWGADSAANGNDPLYGIPVNIVHGNSTAKVNVIIDNYPGESDIDPVPIPANAVIEGDYQDGPNPNGGGYNNNQRGDSHLIVWDEDNNIAYELFGVSRPTDPTLFPNTSGVELAKTDTAWHAAQETVWNMNTDTFRTLGETSADAAGLSILAGLVRPDEGLPVSQGGQGAIDHALRVTLPSGDVDPQYIYPASHIVSVSQGADNLPFGSRLRLANTPAIDALINNMPPESQIIAKAMQQYGLIVADIGSPMFVTGASAFVDNVDSPNVNLTWNMNDIFASNGLEVLNAGDFQVVNLTPVVTGLSTNSGPSGSTITITGQNFSGAAGHLSVLFGSTPSTSVTVVSDTQVTAVVPSGTGTLSITVQSGVKETDNFSDNPNANSTAPIFGYGTSAKTTAANFTITTSTGQTLTSISVTPATSIVTLGANPAFTGTGTYSDNSTQVLTTGVTWSSSNQAVATISNGGVVTTHAAGMTTISASVGNITGSTTLTVVLPSPTVTSLTPASGPPTGGTKVTIVGTNFTGATAVDFGTKAATSFTVVSATKITATAPTGIPGQAVDITVATPGGVSATSAADKFTYTPAPTVASVDPASGPAKGGTKVTITGTNFTGATAVTFGTTAATAFKIVSATEITATAPAGTAGQAVDITVTTPGGISTKSTADRFIYVAAPSITTQPSGVTVTAGQSATFKVVASGNGLIYQWEKLVGSTWVNVSSSNTSSFTGATTASLTITSPTTGDAGRYRVVVSNAGGKDTSTGATLTVKASKAVAPTITENPTSQTVTVGNTVTFTAAASGSPTPTVQWQVSTGGGAFTNIAGATSTTYSFTAQSSESGEEFRAVFTNSAGDAITSAATLTTTGGTIGA